MQITIYKGTHRIGGCVTEIKTAQARIIIDMGSELPSYGNAGSEPLSIDGVTDGEAACDGVFITHYHGDHAGMCGAVLKSVPIYMGETAARIYGVVQRAVRLKTGEETFRRAEDFKTFRPAQAVFIKDIKITPYLTDHSAFDAYMFLIEAGGKRVLHTGDFRMHGARGRKMPEVFSKYARDIDVLITEGTMLGRRNEQILTEHELGAAARKILHENKSVFVLCSSTNIDTIAEFYSAAIAERRMFVVCEDDYQLEILRIVSQNCKSKFYDFTRGKIYVYGKNLHGAMADRGFCFLGRANGITKRAMQAFCGNVLVYSMWKGYLDSSSAAYDGYKSAFVKEAEAGGSTVEYLHTSGHADIGQIRKVAELTGAKIIIPVHTEYPGVFADLGLGGEVRILNDGDSLTV